MNVCKKTPEKINLEVVKNKEMNDFKKINPYSFGAFIATFLGLQILIFGLVVDYRVSKTINPIKESLSLEFQNLDAKVTNIDKTMTEYNANMYQLMNKTNNLDYKIQRIEDKLNKR